MNDFLELFGINDEDLKEEKQSSSRKQKKEKKSATKTTKHSSGSKFLLPIKFCNGHLQHIFKDEENSTWSEDKLKQKIREQFRELSGIFFKIKTLDLNEKVEGIATYVIPEISYKETTDDEVLEFPLEVVAGDYSLWQDAQVSMEEIRSLWVQKHPEYQDCKFMYDEKQKILVPFMEPNTAEGKNYDLPVTVGYLNVKETYTEDNCDVVELNEDTLRQLYSKNHPEFKDCVFAYIESENLLFPIIKEKTVSDNKKISLPVEIRAGGFCIIVKSEDINGKAVATLDEIREVLEQKYPEYSKERTEMIYDKRHFVIPVLKSSRKGIEIISAKKGYKHDIIEDENKCKWRIEHRPFGIFRQNLTETGPVEFKLTAPKIPWNIVEQTIELFRKNPIYEFAVQIFYDVAQKSYFIYVPEQETSRSAVVFQRNPEIESKKILVMDIHSHGAFSAFFSHTDDNDEKGVRLYMVIGNLNSASCSFKLRAGMAGAFGNMALADIFSV